MPKGQFKRKKKPTIKQIIKKQREEILKMSPEQIKRLTKYKITFEDEGQDFLEWFLDEDGNVLDSQPFQRSIWAGKSTVPDFSQAGDLLPIFMEELKGEDCFSHVIHPIKKIEIINKKGDKGR
jgi:hypothetical protein